MFQIDRAPLDALASGFAAEHHCPTIAWAIVHDGDLDLVGSVGDVDERTVYRIASMTKSMSAAATLILRDEGVIRLDEPVASYAPELADLHGPTDDSGPITLRDLLSMTSGLVTDDAWADRHLDLTDDEFDRIIADGCVFAGPTSTLFEYSNFGYAVLGRVVHRASGHRIQEIVTDRLIGPLGMSNTTWVEPGHDSWARPMRWLDGRLVDEIPTPGDGLIAPMGGIWSDLHDLARWVSWLDDAFPARDGSDAGPLRRASRREMQTPQDYVGRRLLRGRRIPTAYGYGLRVLDEPELGRVVAHSGGFPGYGSNMRWLPGRRLGVIALANITYAPMTDLTAHLLDLVHGQGLVPSETWPVNGELEAAAGELIALLNNWNDDDADRLFADNVAPDDSYAHRNAEAAARRPLTVERLVPVNDARARIRCRNDAGAAVTVSFALAPFRPVRIQEYEISTPVAQS